MRAAAARRQKTTTTGTAPRLTALSRPPGRQARTTDHRRGCASAGCGGPEHRAYAATPGRRCRTTTPTGRSDGDRVTRFAEAPGRCMGHETVAGLDMDEEGNSERT